MASVTIPVSLGGTNVPYNDGSGPYGMRSNAGYGYTTHLYPMLAEMIAANATTIASTTAAAAAAAASEAAAAIGAASAQFSEYDALRAYAGTGKAAYITGYLVTASPSGVAGLFTRDDDDTTSEDDGAICLVDALDRRWKRVIEGDINVKWFGAKGNGVTDDTAALVAHRSYCRTNMLPARLSGGTYRVTEYFTLGTDAGGFPYSGFKYHGDGQESTELLLDFDGDIGLDLNPGTGGYTAFSNSSVGAFRVTVAEGRQINNPIKFQNAYNCYFHDIHLYVPASGVDSNFVGVRIGGAIYFNTFRNFWVEAYGGEPGVGRAYYIGNGRADVGLDGANTSENVLIGCRTHHFGIGFDTVSANATTLLGCDAEVCAYGFRDLSTNGTKYDGCWEEGSTSEGLVVGQALVFNGDGSSSMGSGSDFPEVNGGWWQTSIRLEHSYHARIRARYNALTVTSDAEDAKIDQLRDSATVSGLSGEVELRRRLTSPIIHIVNNIGNRPTGWEFGATAGPAKLLLGYSGDDIRLSAYRDAGSGTYRGWRQATDGAGSWVLQQWFTPASLGSESPVDALKVNISGVFASLGVMPLSDNTIDLGDASLRWKDVRAANGTIVTSDEREKQQVSEIDAAVLRAVAKIQLAKFKFTDSVLTKSDGARWHFGVIAQQVKAAFESEGLDPFAYGVLCYDEWEDRYEAVMEEVLVPAVDRDGKPVCDANGVQYILREQRPTGEQRLVMPAGNRYGVRYEELLSLQCAYLASRLP